MEELTALLLSWGLFGLIVAAFTESFISPILPDLLLIPLALADHQNAIWYGLAATAASVVGGIIGYWIGAKIGPAVFKREDSPWLRKKHLERAHAFFEKYGGLTVILARFVPIVRTFAPVAAGVGHMPWRRYTLYNLIGAILWGFGLTMFGYLIGFIPPVATFVENYIDLILLAVVGGTALVTLWHYFSERRKVRKEQAAGVPAESVEPLTDDSPA